MVMLDLDFIITYFMFIIRGEKNNINRKSIKERLIIVLSTLRSHNPKQTINFLKY